MPAPRKYKRSDTASSIVSTGNMDWMEKQTHSLTKLIGRSSGCLRLCSVYAEEQVEYERRQEGDYLATMDRMMKAGQAVTSSTGNLQVELYRQFLFDEESVLTSVTERDDEAPLNENHPHDQGMRMMVSSSPTRSTMGGDSVKSQQSQPHHDYQAIVSQRSH